MATRPAELEAHPGNMLLRVLLELATLVAVGYWGWTLSDGIGRYLLALGLPAVLAAIWGVFAVPDDPSRSGNAPFPVPGSVRLFLELVILALGALAIWRVGHPWLGVFFAGLILVHYFLSIDRIRWLLDH